MRKSFKNLGLVILAITIVASLVTALSARAQAKKNAAALSVVLAQADLWSPGYNEIGHTAKGVVVDVDGDDVPEVVKLIGESGWSSNFKWRVEVVRLSGEIATHEVGTFHPRVLLTAVVRDTDRDGLPELVVVTTERVAIIKL